MNTIKKVIALFIISFFMANTNANAQEAMLGEVKIFAGNFAPRGWAFCAGQLLPISQNQALFSILGTTYGGDGRTTFALPDLRGRVAISSGRGPGLSERRLGARGGSETNVLNQQQLPSHTHAAIVTGITATGEATVSIPASAEIGNTAEPSNSVISATPEVIKNNNEINAYSTEPADAALKPFTAPVVITTASGTVTVAPTGNSLPVTNLQPFTTVNYIIALQGVFPSRS